MKIEQNLIEAIKNLTWKHRYECSDGSTVIGIPCTQISQSLRDSGWRNVPRIDDYDLRESGFKTVRAKYANGASKTRGKECNVVVLN